MLTQPDDQALPGECLVASVKIAEHLNRARMLTTIEILERGRLATDEIEPEHIKAAVENCATIGGNRSLAQQISDKVFQANLAACLQPLAAGEPTFQIIQVFRLEIDAIRQATSGVSSNVVCG